MPGWFLQLIKRVRLIWPILPCAGRTSPKRLIRRRALSSFCLTPANQELLVARPSLRTTLSFRLYSPNRARENVIAGTVCGLGGRVHEQIAWAKLEALSQGARLASKQLWKQTVPRSPNKDEADLPGRTAPTRPMCALGH
jgi:hypothetical protein